MVETMVEDFQLKIPGFEFNGTQSEGTVSARCE
jgi:hypothetical protein